MFRNALHSRIKGLGLRLATGQTAAEYAIVLGVLVPASVLLFTGLGSAVINLITSVAGLLP